MKIIFDKPKREFLENDAKRLLAMNEAKRTDPLVASLHEAQTPRKCDRCGKTYWAPHDIWSTYCSKGCEKEDRQIGF